MTDTTPEKVAYTINEFWTLYHIGHTHFYALQASGEGPVELRAGPRKVLITRRSAEAWERRFEKQPANDDGASNAQWRLNHIQSLIADLSVEPGQLQNSRKPRKRAAPPDESPPPAPLAKPAGVLLLLDGLPSEQLLTVDQVLALIPVSVWTWRRGVRTGIFPAGVRVSRKSVFWRVGDIRAWLEGLKSWYLDYP